MIKKIAVIGNIAGGKSRLCRHLQVQFQLPLTHIDSLQFNSQLEVLPLNHIRGLLQQIEQQDNWIIDGFGPLDMLEARLQKADLVVFVDLPRWRHIWWLTLRQIKVAFNPRPELPSGSQEWRWQHMRKLYQTLNKVDRLMLPELRRILSRPHYHKKLIHIKSLQQLNSFYSCSDLTSLLSNPD